jgi:hypothetical protein
MRLNYLLSLSSSDALEPSEYITRRLIALVLCVDKFGIPQFCVTTDLPYVCTFFFFKFKATTRFPPEVCIYPKRPVSVANVEYDKSLTNAV